LRRITLMIISTLAAVIMLFSYRTSTRGTHTATNNTAAPAGIVTGAAPTPPATGKTGGHPTRKASPKPTTITVNGPTDQTPYGPVQVQVTIAGKRITGVKTLQHPSGDDRSVQIAADALPQLRSETLTAQSADIDAVSGATYTSQGFQHSLQGALDLAHFG
jgi:uncharacterized protein with FMN-binding domain